MRRSFRIHNIIGQSSNATIIIDKDGMRVENKSDDVQYEKDDWFYRAFIKQCIDMDQWKYSWHMDLNEASIKRSEERKRVRKIMLDKIEIREEEIKRLKDGLQILGKWK